MQMLDNLKPNSMSSVEELKLDPQVFRNLLIENIVLVNKVLENSFVIPAFSAFCEQISVIFEKVGNLTTICSVARFSHSFKNFQCKSNTDGAPADYIPQLASFGPQHWGAAICTIDGQRYSIGDANVPFTMQSACQAITYAICLNELGADRVHSFQGKEPSGRAGDDIVLDHQSTKFLFK